MKQAQWRTFADKHLRPLLGEVKAVRDLALIPGDEWLLRALALESSDFSPTKFSLTAFVLPLYVPTRYLYFTFGDRLGRMSGEGEKWWDALDPEWELDVVLHVRREAMPFFDRVGDPSALFAYIDSELEMQAQSDPRIAEVSAYSLLLSKRWEEAQSEIANAKAVAAKWSHEMWAREVAERLNSVIRDISADRDQVIAKFREWRRQNYEVLKLAA